jgi:hypothetical protein
MKHLILALSLQLVHLGSFAQVPPSPPSSSVESTPFTRARISGSLEPTLDLGCINGSQVLSTHTPPDLFLSAYKCIMSGEFERAARLTTIAQAFGIFDVARLTDPTTRGGPEVLANRVISQVPKEKLNGLALALRAAQASSSINDDLCNDLKRSGPPTYYPKYLVLHGLAAYNGQATPENSLKAPFDATATWSTYLRNSIGCK